MDFTDVVERELRSTATWDEELYLRRPENWARWQIELETIKDSIEQQRLIRNRQLEEADKSDAPDAAALYVEYERWNAGSSKVYMSAVKRLKEIELIRSDAIALRRAIQAHRDYKCDPFCTDQCTRSGVHECQANVDLWKNA